MIKSKKDRQHNDQKRKDKQKHSKKNMSKRNTSFVNQHWKLNECPNKTNMREQTQKYERQRSQIVS
jgi:hypothetical protein